MTKREAKALLPRSRFTWRMRRAGKVMRIGLVKLAAPPASNGEAVSVRLVCEHRMRRRDQVSRIEQARCAYGKYGGGVPPFNTYHRMYKLTAPLYKWASEFWWVREAGEVAASLVLDGMPARSPRGSVKRTTKGEQR